MQTPSRASINSHRRIAVNVVTALAAALLTRCGSTTAPAKSTDNNLSLSNLTISAGTLSPVFVAAVTQYSAAVPSAATSVTFTATTTNPKTTIQINGDTQTSATSGVPSAAQAVRVGLTALLVTVFAEDGSVR